MRGATVTEVAPLGGEEVARAVNHATRARQYRRYREKLIHSQTLPLCVMLFSLLYTHIYIIYFFLLNRAFEFYLFTAHKSTTLIFNENTFLSFYSFLAKSII